MAGTTWPDLIAGEKATASKVELKFDWIEGSLVPMIGGAKTTGAYDLGEASYHWRKGYINSITAVNINTTSMSVTSMLANSISCDQISVTNTISSTEIKLSTVQTRYCVLHPGNFVAGREHYKRIILHGFLDFITSPAEAICPVILPNGASITSLKVWYNNPISVSSGAITCNLGRSTHTSTSGVDYATMGTVNSTNELGFFTVEDTTLTFTSINNFDYMYCVAIEKAVGGENTRFQGGLITYEIKGTLPLL